MSKISELGPIKGANTRSEDLFVIVNLIQGDDGTKNITRKELVQALQYEIFDRITITGGQITNVTISRSQIDNNTMEDNVFTGGEVNDTAISGGTQTGTAIEQVTIANSEITTSDFSDGTGNNNIFTNTIVDESQLNNSTGNNNIFTNSTIDDSEYNNVTIDQGTANGLILTNIEIDELILEDAFISNSQIITTDFSNGTINDTVIAGNTEIFDTFISNSDIRDTDLDNVTITNSRFVNGAIWATEISNSNIIDTTANNIVITSSEFNDGTANNIVITQSDFSNGTGDNNTFTNPILQDATLTGSMDKVVATNISIGSSTSEDLVQQRSTIENSDISESNIANSTIEESTLVDFDMDLKKVFEEPIDEDSYFALKNQKTGETEQMTYRQLYNEVSRKTEKALKVHVASDGDDSYDGTILKPVRTLKRAEELALEKAGGSFDRNDINNAVHISVGPGSYYVDEPIVLPDDCSMTSTAGQYATVIQKKKGFEKTNGILVGSGCYVQGFGYMNFEVDNFDQPEGGFAIAYRPGALMRRSPYIRDSSQLSNFNRLDVEPPLNPFNSKGTILDLGQEFYLVAGHSAQNLFEIDDEVTFSSGATGYVSYIADIDSNRQIYIRNLKGNVEIGDILYAQRGGTGTVESIGIDDFPNRLVGRGGGCLLADRAVLDTDSLYTYVLCFGFTPRTQNGTGYVAKNGAGVNGIGSLSIFTRQAFFALDGGQMTLNNSGSQFGDISMRARGTTVIIRPTQATQSNLIANTDFADIIEANAPEIINDMVDYLTANTSTGYNGYAGLGYQGYNADKCYRDTGIIVDNTGYDIATNGNYWGRLNGISYRSPISYLVVNEQLTETTGSIEHLKESVNFIFENSTSDVRDRIAVSLDETLNILNNGEAAANPITFADTGDIDGNAAREVVQDNRDLIIDDFVSWIDNNEEFYAYDGAKCERDVQEYILPAAKFDMLLDTNYNSVTSGLAYYVNTARTSLENQRNETVAAFERLRKTTDELVQANSAPAAVDTYKAFNTIINALSNTGKKYTPSKTTYDPVTGRMVITIGTHDLTVGRYVNLAEESFTFTCSSDNFKTQISHPRKSEKAYLAALPIIDISAKTITVNPGLTAANYEHRFISAKDDAVSVIGEEITFSDNSNIPADKRNARKALQANREFVQDYMMDWVDDEFYFYDSKKCHRDTEQYILPAVQRDLMLGTNYNSIQTGAAYRTKSGEVSVTDQLVETVGSVNYLKAQTAELLTNSIAEDRTNQAFDEMTRLLNNNGKKFNVTTAAYDPVTGLATLLIDRHDFKIGDSIYLEPNSLTFTCDLDGNATEHSYPTTEFIKYTPTNATYDVVTGEFSVTIGTNALKAGDLVEFKPGSIVFTCELDDNVTEHPAPESHHPFYKKQIVIDRVEGNVIFMNVGGIVDGGGVHTFVSAATDAIEAEKRHPAYKKPVKISDVSATEITINVGESSDTSVHTFVSATPNAVREGDMFTGTFTPQIGTTYDPISGDMEIVIGQHDLTVGKWIEIAPESIVFSCDVGGVTGTDAAPLYDHPAYKEPVRVKAITNNAITVNVGNANGHANNHTFVSATDDCIDANALFFADPAKVIKAYTPSTATYDPVSGEFVITIEGHDLTTDDHIELQPQSFVFSCDANGGGNDFSPRIGDFAYKLPLKISAVTTNTLTVNVGDAGTYTGVHTFVSADEGSVVKVGGSQQGVYAARILQKNKAYLQAEVQAYMDTNYFIYDRDKCSRDTGFALDAVRRDLVTGSNVNSVFMGKGYRTGTVGANAVINEQLTETSGAITWLKEKIASEVLTDAASITRSNELFDEIIDIMVNGDANSDELYFGEMALSNEHRQARGALQANKTFIQKEIIAWISANYPSFVYNVAACERDMGIFVDLASWDIQHGSNAAVVSNSKLYFENAIPVLDDNEIVPTSEAYFFATDLIGMIVRNEKVTPLQVVASQTIIETTTFTPTSASYDPANGHFVMDIVGHGMALNDRVTLEPNSFTFTCTMDGDDAAKSYPRAGLDPYAQKTYSVIAKTADTVTLDAGASGPNKYFTPTAADYNAATGVMEVTVGQHGLRVGNGIVLENNSFTFTCDQDGDATQHTYPRVGDPLTGKSLSITAVGSTNHDVLNATYEPTGGDTVLTVTNHGFSNGDYIMLNDRSLNFKCVLDGNTIQKAYPRSTDYASNRWLQISEVTTNTFKFNVGPSAYRGEHRFIPGSPNNITGENVVKRQDGTMTLNVGDAGSASASVHTFVSATANAMKHEPQTPHTFVSVTADAVKVANMAKPYTPTAVAYDHLTGVMTMTIGNHEFTEKDYVIFDENAITFSCASNGGGNLAHPRPTDPIFNKPVRVDSTTHDTITLQVGPAKIDEVHTFVSATTNGVRKSLKPSVSAHVEKLFYGLGETIRENDGTIPAIIEPKVNALTADYGAAFIASYEAIQGQAVKYQTEINDFIYEEYNGQGYEINKCPRDVGYIVDAISEDLEYGGDSATVYNARYYFEGAINTLPYYQQEPSRLAFTHIANIMEKVVKNEIVEPTFGSRFTPTNATYNPATGIMVATIGTHTLTTDDFIWFTEGAITFSCDTGSGPTNHAVPEAHHRFHHKACPIIGADATTITLWVGTGGTGQQAHTFVSALTNGLSQITGNLSMQNIKLTAADTATSLVAKNLALVIANIVDDRLVIPDYRGSLDISLGQQTPRPLPIANADTAPAMDPSRTYARKTLQWNREFIQEEVVQFVKDNNYTYDEAKCARDVGFIIDAVARDVQTGSDYPSQYYGRAYRVGNALAQNVIKEQLAETVEAIKFVRDDILPRLSGVALTRATAAFDNVISIMKNGTDGITYNYGTANVGASDSSATAGLTLNIPFLQQEAISWIAANYSSLVYDETKCRRDTGFLVEAAAFDIRHGSNVAMRDFVKLYFENGINVGLRETQRAPTVALYNHLATVAEQIVLKQSVTPSAGNSVGQITSGFGNVVGGTGADVERLIQIVADTLADDSLINLPQIIEPVVTDPAATGYDQETSVALILDRKESLGGTVVQFLSDNFAFLQYSEERCRRDTGYIVDAISHDIQYGGNSAMHGTAELYFKNAVNILPIDQRKATREAFEYMGKVVQHVIRNEHVPREIGREFTPSGATYNPDTGIFTATIPAGHNLVAGDYVMIAPESIVFTCALDGDIAEHPSPQAGDPYYNSPYYITSADATSITMQVGKVAYGKGGGVHTFVRASLNAISHVTGNTVKQEMPAIAARREIASEAMDLALMLSKVADDNNPGMIPPRIDPMINWIDADILSEKNVIDSNTVKMADDLQVYIYDTYNGISYSKEKCRRDVGTMIDALSHDVNYSTNYASIRTAELYFVNAVSILPKDQRNQTAKFFTQMADVVEKIVIGGTVDASISSHSSAAQVSSTPATAVEAEEVADLTRIVEDAIRRDNMDAVPMLIEPNTSWVDASKIWAAAEIDDNLDELADDITKFLQDTFTIIDYSKAKCRRDAGYIVDAMSWDLNHGGNLATRWNADFYFWNNELRVPEDTRVATAQAYRQLGRIVSDVVAGTYPGQSIRTELGTGEQSTQATELGMILYNALYYNSPLALGPTKLPNFEWETDRKFKFAKDILGNNKTKLQREVQRFITSEYKFIDLPKTYRDGNNLIKILANDFRSIDPLGVEGADKATRSFVGALFNINAQHVFPVFNPPATFADWRKLRFKGTVANQAALDAITNVSPADFNTKRWDAYIMTTPAATNNYEGKIYFWNGTTWSAENDVGFNNTDLLDSFTGAWERMRDYINNNVAVTAVQRTMVTELIDNVLIDSVIRPNFLTFGSLVESIAHQFNGASAGVNRNALPLNFRNVGSAIGANASVLSENGGRIRWSGSDELNNQYFARGLRINGRTGRIEGRPFTSSVRKLARRASNSRAAL